MTCQQANSPSPSQPARQLADVIAFFLISSSWLAELRCGMGWAHGCLCGKGWGELRRQSMIGHHAMVTVVSECTTEYPTMKYPQQNIHWQNIKRQKIQRQNSQFVACNKISNRHFLTDRKSRNYRKDRLCVCVCVLLSGFIRPPVCPSTGHAARFFGRTSFNVTSLTARNHEVSMWPSA